MNWYNDRFRASLYNRRTSDLAGKTEKIKRTFQIPTLHMENNNNNNRIEPENSSLYSFTSNPNQVETPGRVPSGGLPFSPQFRK